MKDVVAGGREREKEQCGNSAGVGPFIGQDDY